MIGVIDQDGNVHFIGAPSKVYVDSVEEDDGTERWGVWVDHYMGGIIAPLGIYGSREEAAKVVRDIYRALRYGEDGVDLTGYE